MKAKMGMSASRCFGVKMRRHTECESNEELRDGTEDSDAVAECG
jgi:hypothetical protein